jgi:hypothetical protein
MACPGSSKAEKTRLLRLSELFARLKKASMALLKNIGTTAKAETTGIINFLIERETVEGLVNHSKQKYPGKNKTSNNSKLRAPVMKLVPVTNNTSAMVIICHILVCRRESNGINRVKHKDRYVEKPEM